MRFGSAIVWFVAGFFILSLSQLLAGVVLAEETSRAGISEVLGDGDVLSLTFVLALPALLAAMLPIISLRSDTSVSEWLDIRPVAPGRVLVWFGYMTALLVIYLLVGTLMTRSRIPEWIQATWETVDFPLGFLFVVSVLGPMFEEVLYRGHILKLLMTSPLGSVGGSVFSSALWALSHFQYDAFDVGWIFLLGLLLCSARLFTGSLITAIVLHGTWNLISALGVIWQLG